VSLTLKLKQLVFNETDDPGKVCLISWEDSTNGYTSLLVPVAAFDRAKTRATLRAVRIKIPQASSVVIKNVSKTPVNYPTTSYYLVRAHFTTE
jgi:hypothetical protein